MGIARLPRHVGFIPDGNRRWADARGLPRQSGYAAGIEPGLRLLERCRELRVAEVSVYGFTKENVRRARSQVDAFRRACVDFGLAAVAAGAALLAVGDTDSALFPDELRPFARERGPGDVRFNLLVNYGWQWDLGRIRARCAEARPPEHGREYARGLGRGLGSGPVPRIDLVVRWGGRQRLSGFLPLQCAYADLFVVDTLWPDMQLEEFHAALAWYATQDVTLGG